MDKVDLIEQIINGAEFKALSWKEPFASLMLHGKIETRTWNTNYRGLVLICATKKGYLLPDLSIISGHIITNHILERVAYNNLPLHSGKAFAVGKLVDCRPMKHEDQDACFVTYKKGLYCHVYKDVAPIKPFDWKGCQGWKKVSDEIINQIEFI